MGQIRTMLFVFLAVALPSLCAQSVPHKASVSEDLSGMYSFLREGESVQINVEKGRLSGWVTSFGMLESDKDTMVDRFFKKATLDGDQIYFITKPLHGCWVEFTGRVERSDAKMRSQEGYYRLAGTLTQYTTDENNAVSAKQREAVFKSAPDEVLADAPPKE